jgi:hypothetical protein
MKKTEIDVLIQYLYNVEIFLEDEVHQNLDFVRYRRSDSIDCLEYMISVERLQMFRQTKKDILSLLKLYDKE